MSLPRPKRLFTGWSISFCQVQWQTRTEDLPRWLQEFSPGVSKSNIVPLGCLTHILPRISFIFSLHYLSVCVWIKEMWSTDSNKVQEFMFSYLKDPLREVEQPYFHQDEVHTCTHHLPALLSLSIRVSYSGFSCSKTNVNLWLRVTFSSASVPHCWFMWEMLRSWHE